MDPRRRRRSRGLAALGACTLLTCLLSATPSHAASAPAAGVTKHAGSQTASATSATGSAAGSALQQATSTGQPVSIPSMTTETQDATANPDGTITVNTYAAPVRVQQSGSWTPVDATLHVTGDTVSPAAVPGGVTLSDGGSGPLATLRADDRTGNTLAISWPQALPVPTLSGDTATYSNVLPGVDLDLTVDTQGGLSEVLVVTDATAANNPALQSITFDTTTNGLDLRADASGNLSAVNNVGQTDFYAPAPPHVGLLQLRHDDRLRGSYHDNRDQPRH